MDAYIDEILGMAAPETATPELPLTRRPLVRDAKILNPKTGKLVKVDGKVGRQVLADQRRALEVAGAVLPRGVLRGPQPARAVPGLIERDDEFIAQRRGYQRAGAFILQRWNIPGRAPETVAQFARAIGRAREAIPAAQRRHVNVDFVDEDGARITRAVTGRTLAELVAQIDALQGSGVALQDSDVISPLFRLDTSSFALGSVHPPGGGALKFTGISKKTGRRHPHFRLTDFSGKQRVPGDCLLAIMRAVAATVGLKPERGWPRNSTIRSELGLEPAPANISADGHVINQVATYFGLRVRVVTGMDVPPDAEREFDDNPARLIGRNSCHTVAEPVVIAQGGSEDAPLCDVYLADEHYEYIAAYLRVETCPATGDIVGEAMLDPTGPATGDIVDETLLDPENPNLARRIIAQGRPYYADDIYELETVEDGFIDHREYFPDFEYREHVIVFDYETTYDPNDGTLEAYALGFMIFDPKRDSASGEFANSPDRVVQVIRGPLDNRYAVTNVLIDAICRAPRDVRYTLVSFNGSRFDNFLLAAGANNRGLLNSIFATTAGGLRDVRIGRHETLDLAKLAPAMSLAAACAGFKTSPRKVEGFSHLEPQIARETGRLDEWLTENRGKLAEYLVGDVLSTASLFVKLTKTLTRLSKQPCYGDRSTKTIGGHAYALMSSKCELPGPVASEELDKHIRTSIVGGRVEVYDDPQLGKAPRIELEPAYMVDFASLYPTVMAGAEGAKMLFERDDGWGLYPDAVGAAAAGLHALADAIRRHARTADRELAVKKSSAAQKRAVKEFRDARAEPIPVAEYRPGAPGIYRVTIHEQPPGLPCLIPRRGETLDWSYRGEFDAVISHVSIALIRRYGGRVTVHSGHIWENATLGLFEPFVRELAEIKDRQDSLNADDPSYNPALRMVVKLLMNAASGKCCQANYDDCAVIAKGSGAQLLAESKMSPHSPTIWIPLGGETCVIVGKKPQAKVYTKRAKPSILATLIYEYSRALVWRTLCQHRVLYSDTDSGLFRRADYEALRHAFPDLDPAGRAKKLGDLEQELKPHARAIAFRLAPKDYAVFLYDAAGKLLPGSSAHKIRMKGVNQRSDRLLHPGAGALLRGRPAAELASAYNAAASELSAPLSDPEVALDMYERRAAGESVDVLCSQLMRGTLSVERPLELYQRFIIKRLSGHAPEVRDVAGLLPAQH